MQDTYYVGTIKGIGRIYQQTFVDTYAKVAACKLYTTKTPITAADLLNDRVLPMLEDNGICERFHRTVKDEFYEITFRKKVYSDLAVLQADIDAWVNDYNYERSHQGKMCCGKTPMQTLREGRELWEAKVGSLN